MTPIEVIATVTAVFILLKICFVVIHPKTWLRFGQAVSRHSILAAIVYLVLIGIVGYYVFARLNIVEVAAVMLFTSLLLGFGLLPSYDMFLRAGQDIATSRTAVLRKYGLALAVWIPIALWVLTNVFS